MAILTDIIILRWVITISLIITVLTIWIRFKLTYWKKKKVPYLEPRLPWGNLNNLLVDAKSIGHVFWDFYQEMKRQGSKYAGFYTFIQPIFVPIDPETIKQILIKDFWSFHERGFYNNEKNQPMSANLFTIDGPKWRTLRYKFSPTFASGKIKYMYKLIEECVHPLSEMIAKSAKNKRPINVKDIISRFTTDTISSCAFGVDCNSFNENPVMYKMVNNCLQESSKFERLAVLNAFPNLCRFFKIGLFINEHLNYFGHVLTESFENRKKNLVYRTDLLQVMKNIHEKKDNEDFDLTLDEIRAHSFLFFIGGYETSSTAMGYLFLELAENIEIQDKLRQEIIDVSERYGGISYEVLNEMKYLQCVIDETLRKYPPLTVLNRKCTEDYELPNGEVLEKGINIIIPVLGIHRDPEYYPNPDVFYPDRFSDENKATRPPYTYLPFGDGPRNCIGARFGLIQIKVAVSYLVKRFRFTVNKNTDTTRRYTTHFIITLAQDILLDVEDI